MGQSIEEVLNRLVAVEDAAQQMQEICNFWYIFDGYGRKEKTV